MKNKPSYYCRCGDNLRNRRLYKIHGNKILFYDEFLKSWLNSAYSGGEITKAKDRFFSIEESEAALMI